MARQSSQERRSAMFGTFVQADIARRNLHSRLAALDTLWLNLAIVGALEENWRRCALTAAGVSQWRPSHAMPCPDVTLNLHAHRARRRQRG